MTFDVRPRGAGMGDGKLGPRGHGMANCSTTRTRCCGWSTRSARTTTRSRPYARVEDELRADGFVPVQNATTDLANRIFGARQAGVVDEGDVPELRTSGFAAAETERAHLLRGLVCGLKDKRSPERSTGAQPDVADRSDT